ncbi:MAG: hypothetical protein K6G88_02415 [Lachnospiraceae bacterium]|nr:hypothetical protein [Lachnospiraceae bacterium]
MRKKLDRALVALTTGALVTTMFAGTYLGSTIRNDAVKKDVSINNWSFTQGGKYNPNEPGNEGYIGNVKMQGTEEELAGWLNDDNIAEHPDKQIADSVEQTFSATKASNGFTMSILNTGWDAIWTEDVEGVATKGVIAQDILSKEGKEVHVVGINPWSVQASTSFSAEHKHVYTVSFKAKASKKKYAQVAFTCGDAGAANGGDPILGQNLMFEHNNIIELGTKEKEYTFQFTNWVDGDTIAINFMLGAFDAAYDQAGVPLDGVYDKDWVKVADSPKVEVENKWAGKVIVTDLKVTDCDLDATVPTTEAMPDLPTVAPTKEAPTTAVVPTQPTTTKAPSVAKPGKVTIKKAVNQKGKKIKITWKKVSGAKSYQVKVGSKSYTAKKTSYVAKKLKVGKSYKIKVRAKNAAGYGKWSKAKKVKVKK